MNFKIISGTKKQYKLLNLETGEEVFSSPRKTLLYQYGSLLIGDEVVLESDKTIGKLLPRRNSLIRPRIANIDLAIVVASCYKPEFSSYLLDKFLSYLDYCHVPSAIVFAKVDMLNEKEYQTVREYEDYYSKIGYQCFMTSTKDLKSYEPIIEVIKGKVVAFTGQTGAGKSTLINHIDNGFERAIGEYSEALGRGKHQTKEVILLPYNNGLIGDTPGFSSLDLKMIGMSELDLALNFPGYQKYALKCYYNNCKHLIEKDCQVKKAIEEGKLSEESYQNYQKLLKEIKEGKNVIRGNCLA